MSTVKDLLGKVEGDETPSVFKENKEKQIESHAKVLESLIEEVHELKVEVQRIEKRDDQRGRTTRKLEHGAVT
jgi:hypothetical protein